MPFPYSCYLCSSFATIADHLTAQQLLPPGSQRIWWITNASDADMTDGSLPRWIANDKSALEQRGYRICPCDLRTHTSTTLKKEMNWRDGVFVCWGNTFWLLSCMQQSWFTDLIHDFIAEWKTYLSTSAGSCVACPDIGYVQFADDPSVVSLDSTKGLGLTNCYLDVHFGPDDTSAWKAFAYCRTQVCSPYLTLSDQQACLIDKDGKMNIVSI